MRRLVWDASFRRAVKQIQRSDPELCDKVFAVLADLKQDPFLPKLRTHKLRGRLDGLWACSVAYDCRIVFFFEADAPNQDAVVLVDVGTHEDVY